jgi:hypothetical protein
VSVKYVFLWFHKLFSAPAKYSTNKANLIWNGMGTLRVLKKVSRKR